MIYKHLKDGALSALHYYVTYEMGGPKEVKALMLNALQQAHRANVLEEALICYFDDHSLKTEEVLKEALAAYQEGKG